MAAKKRKMKEEEEQEESQETFHHWLIKSEPESRMVGTYDVKFSIEDLKKKPNQTSCWDGIRNFRVKNFIRDHIKVGQELFFYHSSCKVPAIVGIVRVTREAYPDTSALDKNNVHYDPKSSETNTRFYQFDVQFVRDLKRPIPLSELRSQPELADMMLLRVGRLSITPVSQEHWDFILGLEDKDPVDVKTSKKGAKATKLSKTDGTEQTQTRQRSKRLKKDPET
eukprot:GILK01009894.1.p1 GENE.GILK01009894.1~~GILK01009894.1.p1  ORF type:complete len:240 (+),score=38.26 GILK01009894.1:50-721(+)